MKKILFLASLCFITLALYAQGSIVVWGSPHNSVSRDIPAGEDFVEIAAGFRVGLAIREDGSLVAWGHSNDINGNVPAGNNFIAIAAGESHAVALRSDGTVEAWGKNNKGQLNVPAYNDIVQISTGQNHTLAIRADGSLLAWGDNSGNQCNVPDGNFIDIAAGDAFSLALKTDGSIVGWGSPWNDRLNIPTGNDFVQISAQNLHSIARKSDGSIVAWGNATDNLDVPASGVYVNAEAAGQGNVAIRDDGLLVAWANIWVLKTVPEWIQDLNIVKVAGGDEFFLGLTGPFAENDADDDGVADSLDEYPEDPLRAYSLCYPLPSSATGWGTLAFEDMWPQQGDYDFNDLVLDYQITQVLDADMKIKDIKANFLLSAVGATFQNAFAIEFPFPVTNVQSHSGIAAGAAYDMPILEAGANSILKVISSTNDFVSVPGGGIFWNTQPEQAHYEPIPISFELTLIEPLELSTLPFWGFWNPYLMVNREQGHEIHLPGYPPTIHADTELFGKNDDSTNPAENRYYKTITNLPWALDLPVKWNYPIEHKEISQAYYRFAPWAESAGSQYPDWYELDNGDINPSFIYDR